MAQTIPIVMTSVGDPVGTGLVDSLARPGGNITGNTTIIGEMAGKRLELLKRLVPRLSRVALLGFPGDPIVAVQMRHAEAVARSLKVEVFPVEIRAISELVSTVTAPAVAGLAGDQGSFSQLRAIPPTRRVIPAEWLADSVPSDASQARTRNDFTGGSMPEPPAMRPPKVT
jgi:hypothetical protein